MLRVLERHRVDVAGLQEVASSQRHALSKQMHAKGYTQYPRAGAGGDNRVVWRTKVFDPVRTSGFKVPYFNGHMTWMPAALLRHRATGQEAWFLSIHNPAETARFHHQGGHRARAVRMERAEVRRLLNTGRPVFLTGDFNSYAGAFCPLTKGGLTTAAAGGRHHRGCRLPKRSQIDWIFGAGGPKFTGYRTDWAPTRTHVSDHPIVFATVTLGAGRTFTAGSSTSGTGTGSAWANAPAHLVSQRRWERDVRTAMAGSRRYLAERLAAGGHGLGINIDIDNTSLATHYDHTRPVAAVLDFVRAAQARGVTILFNTGRLRSDVAGVTDQLRRAGFSPAQVCGRTSRHEGLAHAKQRCRRHFAHNGYTLIANVGNRRTDFIGNGYERGFRLPNYHGRLS